MTKASNVINAIRDGLMHVTEKMNDDNTLPQYLSMNLPVQRYTQTDGEALLQAISIYVGYIKDGKMERAAMYASGKNQLINVGYTMPDKEAREFAVQLYRLEGYMGHTTAFASKWIKDNVMRVHGGVSDKLHVKDRTFKVIIWYR